MKTTRVGSKCLESVLGVCAEINESNHEDAKVKRLFSVLEIDDYGLLEEALTVHFSALETLSAGDLKAFSNRLPQAAKRLR